MNKKIALFGLLLLVSVFLFGCNEPVIQTFTISGHVSGADNVTIVLGGDRSWRLETTTDGAFSFTGLHAGSYLITPIKEGVTFTPASRTVTLSDYDSTGNNFAANSTATYSISGTVAGADGATVTLGGAKAAAVVTKANGYFAFSDLSDGSYSITPSEADYSFSPSTRAVTISESSSTGNNFSASRFDTYSISGVIDGAESVRVTLAGDASSVTVTNADGYYAFGHLSNGDYTVTPDETGYVFSPASRSVKISNASSTGNNFTADSTNKYSISGTVVGADNVTVTLGGAAAQATTTNAEGHYAFNNLGNGSYTVTPSVADHNFSPASKSITIQDASSTGNNFVASRHQTYSISGVIKGADSVVVTLGGAYSTTTVTNADGYYAFGHLDNGDYTVTPSKTGYDFAPTSRSVTIADASSTDNNFSATAPTTYSLSGLVSGADNVTLTLGGDSSATTSTDGSGYYAFSSLSNGTYTITPSKIGYAFTPESRSLTITDESVTGNNFTANLAGLYSLSGYITGADSVTVNLDGQSLSTVTGADGYYAFHHLTSGNYTVVPQKSGYDFAPTSQSVVLNNTSTTEVNFAGSPSPTYSISGKIKAFSFLRHGVTITLSGDASKTYRTDANGHYAFNNLNNGNYTVTPSRPPFLKFVPTHYDININGASSTGNDFRLIL